MNCWITLALIGCASVIIVCDCGASGPRRAVNERLLLMHPVNNPSENQSCQSVFDGILEQLTDKGYRIVDKALAEQCSLQIAITHDIDPDLNKAASFGLKYFAENTIFFKTTTIIKDNESGKGALVKVSAKIVDNTSSQVITSKSSDASSSGLTVTEAVDKAGRSAGKKLASNLAAALEKYYRECADKGRIYTIVIECPDIDVNPLFLLAWLEKNKAVSAAKEFESGGGKTTFEISYMGKRDQLDRDILKAAGELGWKLQKVRSEGNRSTWKIK